VPQGCDPRLEAGLECLWQLSELSNSNFKFENLKFSEILNLKFEIDLLASAERCQNSAGE